MLNSGCTGQEPEVLKPVCNSPYILVGTDCCLDENSNNICDRDEEGRDQTSVSSTTLFKASTTTSTIQTQTPTQKPDNDGDGFTSDVDCEDLDSTIFPGASEACDGVDNDCDGTVDNGGIWANLGSECFVGIGECAATGSIICNILDPLGPPVCSAKPGVASPEICDDKDNDCDGTVDDDDVCAESDGNEKEFCDDPRPELCVQIYDPVCGWFDSTAACLKYPCAQTYSNSCEACRSRIVLYWTDGECPSG